MLLPRVYYLLTVYVTVGAKWVCCRLLKHDQFFTLIYTFMVENIRR